MSKFWSQKISPKNSHKGSEKAYPSVALTGRKTLGITLAIAFCFYVCYLSLVSLISCEALEVTMSINCSIKGFHNSSQEKSTFESIVQSRSLPTTDTRRKMYRRQPVAPGPTEDDIITSTGAMSLEGVVYQKLTEVQLKYVYGYFFKNFVVQVANKGTG